MNLQSLGYFADTILILASLTWLADWTPLDCLGIDFNLTKVIKAKNELLKNKIIFKSSINTNETYKVSASEVAILSQYIKKNWANSASVDWANVLGVGIFTLNLPTMGGATAGFQTFHLFLEPAASDPTKFTVVTVGLIDDMDNWINSKHQSNMIKWVGGMLIVGFASQLAARILSSPC